MMIEPKDMPAAMATIAERMAPKLVEGMSIRATSAAVVLGFRIARARDVKLAVRDIERAFAALGILHYEMICYRDELALIPKDPPKENV